MLLLSQGGVFPINNPSMSLLGANEKGEDIEGLEDFEIGGRKVERNVKESATAVNYLEK